MAGELTIRPGRDDWRLAREVYSLFVRKEGSGHIATRFALAHLAAILREQPVRSVLEFGSGIGTITHLLLKLLPADTRIVCIEPNDWCREQFAINIPAREHVTLLPEKRPTVPRRSIWSLSTAVRARGTTCTTARSASSRGTANTRWQGSRSSLRERGYYCRMKNYPGIGFKVRWRMSRFGISFPAR